MLRRMPAGIGVEQVHRFSIDEYHRLVDAGAFAEDARAELLDGLLVDMSPKSPAHERVVRWLTRRLVPAVDDERYAVGVSSPLTLGASEPEPDLAVIPRDAPAPYHPATAALVIEVAASSLPYDLGSKAAVYASADIPELWVVDLDGRRVIVHRRPADGGYTERFDVRAGGALHAVAVEISPVPVAELLDAARA